MKTNFALNFTDTSIALLHRTARGWIKVGETPFDTPDLTEALDYLRKTALGLEPGGFTTKLVIPASQVLYTEVEMRGTSEDDRRSEIIRALEDRTPYKADEIAYDFSGRGKTIKVAAVARDTLDEAEGFATEHQFNPVGFVAIPEGDSFAGEPWFGETAVAAELLAAGDRVERDRQAIVLLADKGRARRRAAVEPEADLAAVEAVTEVAAVTGDAFPEVAESISDEAELELSASQSLAPELPAPAPAEYEPEPDAEVAAPTQDDLPPDSPAPEAISAAVSAPSITEWADAEPQPAPELDEPEDLDIDAEAAWTPAPQHRPAPIPAPSPAQPELQIPPKAAASFTAPEPLASIAESALHPMADRSPNASIAPVGRGVAHPAPSVTAPLAPAFSAPPVVAPPPAPASAAPVAPLAPPTLPIQAAAVTPPVEEAPFADVPEMNPFPEQEEDLDLPPVPPHAAARAQTDARNEDLPPAPSQAILAAYNRGRTAPAPDSASQIAPETTPETTPERPSAAAIASRVIRPTANLAEDRPLPPRPAPKPASKGLSALVTAPSIPGTRKARSKPVAPISATGGAGTSASNLAADEAARSLGRANFEKTAPRGKPRHLGLILTVILLVCLALVAAWSSFYLASLSDETPSETAVAANDTSIAPATTSAEGTTIDGTTAEDPNAEGLDPEALADGDFGPDTADSTTAASSDTAPATASNVAGQLAASGADPQGEIALALADAPPPAFDALSLPATEGAEAPPEAPMPPPPFGTVYRYDAAGLLIPTPDGIPSPDGYTIYEGKPKLVPPEPSAVALAAAEAARTAAAATPAASTEAAPVPSDQFVTTPAGAASLLDTSPLPPAAAEAATAGAIAPVPAAQPNPELADRRPRLRPDSAPSGDDAALQPAPSGTISETADASSPRPRSRPESLETARSQTAAASLAAGEAEVTLASAAAAVSLSDAANPSLLTISRRPVAKPKDFSNAVEAAVAAAIRAPEPEPEPVLVAAAAPAPAPVVAPKASEKASAAPRHEEDDAEPEVASAAPRIPTKASVAKQATFKKAINLSKINLIGIYGSNSNRYALVRMSNGKFRKVGPGDKLDGGTVKAITAKDVRYQKGSRLISLEMPKG